MLHSLKNNISIKFIILSLCLGFGIKAFSQGPPPPPPPPPPTTTKAGPACWPPPCVPIDNGILILAIAAFAYGANKLYRFKKAIL